MMIPQLSLPGWALALIATLTILMQAPNIYNPSTFMDEFKLTNKPAAQLIAFCLVLVNGYDLLGVLQDNWVVYWYSLVSRMVALGLFWSMGPPWNKLVGFELVTGVVLGVAMYFA